MKLKFGKALLMATVSLGVILGVSSCVQSYTVGYLYVTGTATDSNGLNGIISGFKIDHNKGLLTPINGLPISSNGANPVRAILLSGSRYIYVLNRGQNSEGNASCTTADPCQGANISLFSIGGNGVLSQQGPSYSTQGFNPIRMFADSTGSFLYVLDQVSSINGAPASATNPNANCQTSLGQGVTTCGDITAFKIDPNTGRLTLIVNAQATSANGNPLTYFPVPDNPIDFVSSNSFLLTLTGTPATGNQVFPYTVGTAGQLTNNQNTAQSLAPIAGASAIVSANSLVYILDSEGGNFGATGVSAPSWIFPFAVASNGALQSQTGGAVPGDSTLSNPIYLLQENKAKWIYIANSGGSDGGGSGLAGWVIDPTTKQLTPEIPTSPWDSGTGPQCVLEDPSNQFIYTANSDATVNGHALDVQSGTLNPLPAPANKQYPLRGPATWCLVSGRTT